MAIGTTTAIVTCAKVAVGVASYAFGFAPIATNTIASSLMSVAWKTGVGIPVISFLQSSAAMVANAVAVL